MSGWTNIQKTTGELKKVQIYRINDAERSLPYRVQLSLQHHSSEITKSHSTSHETSGQRHSALDDLALKIYSYEAADTECLDKGKYAAIFQEEFKAKCCFFGYCLKHLTFLDVPYSVANPHFLTKDKL